MQIEMKPLAGGLYFVATPIGSARDITLRALDVLANADVIAAEDTRTLRRLLDIHGVTLGDRQVIAYHDHNGPQARPKLIAMLNDGKSVAYASEAGTPLVADPGYALARGAIDAGHPVTSAPGPSAMIAALTIGGLPTDRFMFVGFAPNAKAARRSFIEETANISATLVFYESPKRLAAFLEDAASVLGGERQAAICRELTKKFEEVRRGTLDELRDGLHDMAIKGEVVVLIDRERLEKISESDIDTALREALKSMRVKDAAETVANALGVAKRQVYQRALSLGKDG